MIKSFANPETEAVFDGLRPRRLPPTVIRAAARKLLIIHGATVLSDLAVPPGNRLEKLKGGRRGQHSIRINDHWRICFTRRDGRAFDVEVTDYHS